MKRLPNLSAREKAVLAGFGLALAIALGMYTFLAWMGGGFPLHIREPQSRQLAVLIPRREGALEETTRQAVAWAIQHPFFQSEGPDLEVKIYPVGISPDAIAWTARRIANQPETVAFLGPLDLRQAVAVWNVAQGLPVFSTISTAPVGKDGLPQGLYRLPTPDDRQGEALAAFCTSQGWSRVVLITDSSAYAQRIAKRLASQISLADTLDIKKASLSESRLKNWKEQGIQALIWVAGAQGLSELSQWLSKLDWRPGVVATDLAISDALQQFGQHYPVYYTTPMFMLPEPAENIPGKETVGKVAHMPYAYETIQAVWAMVAAWQEVRPHRGRLSAALDQMAVADPWMGTFISFQHGLRVPEYIFVYRVTPGAMDWRQNPVVYQWVR